VAAPIVSVAQLAWMIYGDHRKETREIIERTRLRRHIDITPESAHITDVVVH
jgi:hypothetical protein